MRWLVLALCLAGCGKPNTVFVDPQLAPYMQNFTQTIGVSSDGIEATFAQLDKSMVGECILYDSGAKVIHVDSASWATASEDQRQQTMFHELGHCAMGLQHTTTLKADNCPTSIMYPYEFGDSPCYVDNKPYYFQELKSQ